MSIINRVQWGDMAAWISGGGTLIAAWVAVRQYRKNSLETTSRIKRQQAEKVTSWIISNNGQTAWHTITNQSKNPIYEVIVSLVAFQGAGDMVGKVSPIVFKEFLSAIPPGTYYAKTAGNTGMSFHPSSCIAFVDSNGTSWLRKGDGSLEEIAQKPIEYYGIPRPIGWGLPRKEPPKKADGF